MRRLSDVATADAGVKKVGKRLCVFISSTGLSSRREAEKLIFSGRVSIRGKVCRSPTFIVGEEDALSISVDDVLLKPTYAGLTTPPKLWAVHKNSGETVDKTDRKGRVMLLDRIKPALSGSGELFPVYRLDYLCEGLQLITNNARLAKFLNSSSLALPLMYKLRLHGLVTESKLRALQNGIAVDGVRAKPMTVKVEHRSHTITWLTIETAEKQQKLLPKVLEKLHLKLYRSICVGFGPFASSLVTDSAGSQAGSGVKEVKLPPSLNSKFLEWEGQRSQATKVVR